MSNYNMEKCVKLLNDRAIVDEIRPRIQYGAGHPRTPFQLAIIGKNLEICRSFLDHGANANQPFTHDKFNQTTAFMDESALKLQ